MAPSGRMSVIRPSTTSAVAATAGALSGLGVVGGVTARSLIGGSSASSLSHSQTSAPSALALALGDISLNDGSSAAAAATATASSSAGASSARTVLGNSFNFSASSSNTATTAASGGPVAELTALFTDVTKIGGGSGGLNRSFTMPASSSAVENAENVMPSAQKMSSSFSSKQTLGGASSAHRLSVSVASLPSGDAAEKPAECAQQ